MRPIRFLLTLASCIAAFFLLLYVGPWRATTEQVSEEQSPMGTYFNWRTPSSLFPPSAIISLTDDNSTFFLARPAAFGPLLPVKSLSGQLWIGSGFGADRLGPSGSAEGELGCSDVPGWNDGSYASSISMKSVVNAKATEKEAKEGLSGKDKRKRDHPADVDVDEQSVEDKTQLDGTDDHLHHPLPASDGLRTNGAPTGHSKKPTHADIQSLQEGAEIAGKVVLLSRGGCGFLEKAKWVQRRGGVALIVGDDIRGGPLVTMYARGDTSNVTIPSLFTSHTTAHLLSSLIPSGGLLDGISVQEAERLGLVFGNSDSTDHTDDASNAVFTTTTTNAQAASTQKTQTHDTAAKDSAPKRGDANGLEEVGWLKSLLFGRGSRNVEDTVSPSSGHAGWVLQQEFDGEDNSDHVVPKKQATTDTTSVASTKTLDPAAQDGFVIGVQDWRDPDLVAEQKEQLLASSSSSTSPSAPRKTQLSFWNGPKGGSITPGSGEYAKDEQEGKPRTPEASKDESPSSRSQSKAEKNAGWFSNLFASHEDPEEPKAAKSGSDADAAIVRPQQGVVYHYPHNGVEAPEIHTGLWITLTPTSMSSSPFFDTLLVLVVSPLVTLTVVYALLLLRSRIRRRRWRAPKSVVERLPVRTYQTMPSTTNSSSTTSSIASPVTVTTPLLPSNARPINARSRPRSRTTPEMPIQPSSSAQSDDMASPSLEQVEEKRAAGLSEWRKRYGGKQRECVVCLEEYVDGVSRVMSLPCGHEFHAECITPWLTTRRRTCPICKGDVVRSLTRSGGSSSSSPAQGAHHDEEDPDDVQEQAAVARNDDPVAALPVSREDEAFEDLERGVTPDRTR